MSRENPANLKYSKGHQWISIDGDVATVGITDHAQEALTELVFIELPKQGKSITKGHQLCVVESLKSASEILSPVSGEIIVFNKELKEHPDFVNKDAYGLGWMVKIKISDMHEIKELMSAEQYEKFLKDGK